MYAFWSSGDLTGNQTDVSDAAQGVGFWSSGDLTGNQTIGDVRPRALQFWSSGDLTGNQTPAFAQGSSSSFGAVAI